jgi:hypothetical protein
VGSRRGRHAALVAALAIAGCTVGAPPGFSSGSYWRLPLVGPLENGLLVVPAMVNGYGPFLFAIDPDAKISVVDEEVVKVASMRGLGSVHFLDETDTQQVRIVAEVTQWTIGDLVFEPPTERRTAMVVKAHTFDSDGRRIHGLIGRDIIADSLVFGFDRDAGTAVLVTTKQFTAGTKIAVHYDLMSVKAENAEVPPLGRRLAKAQINGRAFMVHLDFGAVASQLREEAWQAAKLAPAEIAGAVVDEVGMARTVTKEGTGAVSVGRAVNASVTFVPFAERRWASEEVAGSLGLGFWKTFSVWVSWDKSTVYLDERKPAAEQGAEIAKRIARWRELAKCPHDGCATVSLIDPLANTPPEQKPAQHPGVVVSVARDGGYGGALEVLISAKGDHELRSLIASLPEGTDRAMTHLPAEYVGAKLEVVDASPFPRACPGDGGCIDTLAAR